jgi:hypothetical protein
MSLRDIDIWIDESTDNLARVERALVRFGAPESVIEALRSAKGLDVAWMGNPPMRVDLMKQIPGCDFAVASPRASTTTWDGVAVHIVGLEDLIASKRASGRPQDLIDIEILQRIPDM